MSYLVDICCNSDCRAHVSAGRYRSARQAKLAALEITNHFNLRTVVWEKAKDGGITKVTAIDVSSKWLDLADLD